MKSNNLTTPIIVTIALVVFGGLALLGDAFDEHAFDTSLIREEKRVEVGGVGELWRLVWRSAPKFVCGPDSDWSTCPCTGFAFGQAGQLDLVRIRDGREYDRLPLTSLFGHDDVPGEGAVVQRWEVLNQDLAEGQSEELVQRVHARPVVSLIRTADYDHDGKRTEFYLQTGTLPCGKNVGVIVGVSGDNPRLHAFSSALHPHQPLYLQKHEWSALASSDGIARATDWPCGDHGGNTETEISLQITREGIRAFRNDFQCDQHDKRGRLIRSQEF